MATAQDIFDEAMALMDEVDDAGKTDTSDTAEYKNRTLYILNVLRGELYPYSDTFLPNAKGFRPITALIEDFETPIDLDDYICESVMPYGLAAHLFLDENPSAASFFQQRYEELLSKLSRGLPAVSEEIVDVHFGNNTKYGGFEYDWMGRW